MAHFPCDVHHAGFNGGALRLYLNVYDNGESCAFRFSVCRDCADDLVSGWLGSAAHRSADGYWDPPVEGETLDTLLETRSGSLAPRKPYP